MDLFPLAFPALSPLVVEDLRPRPTEHAEVLQDRAEAALGAKVRAGARGALRRARRAAARGGPRGSSALPCLALGAALTRARHRGIAQLSAVREAGKDVTPIGTRKSDGDDEGAPKRPPLSRARRQPRTCSAPTPARRAR